VVGAVLTQDDAGRPTTTYEVIAVRYGTLTADRSAQYAAYGAYGQADVPMTMDYYFWVLRSGARTVVVDTGFRPEVGRRRGRDVLCSPLAALQRLGVAPAAVEEVVLTHFHYDHIGNAGLFPTARLVVARRELDFWSGPLGTRPAVATAVEPEEVEVIAQARREGRVAVVPDEAPDLPGIQLIDLGGHTPGQLGVLVDTGSGTVVLASDAAHFYEEFERDMPFHLYTDIEGMFRGFAELRRLAAAPSTVVVPGHDPDTMRRFPPAGPGLADLAVRIA
jgi:glyoxylase-like metal-dependent hydrolase (beta-lactamase superfamily II)